MCWTQVSTIVHKLTPPQTRARVHAQVSTIVHELTAHPLLNTTRHLAYGPLRNWYMWLPAEMAEVWHAYTHMHAAAQPVHVQLPAEVAEVWHRIHAHACRCAAGTCGAARRDD